MNIKKMRELAAATAMIDRMMAVDAPDLLAMLDVIEAAQLWRQRHSPQGISELGLEKALDNLEKLS